MKFSISQSAAVAPDAAVAAYGNPNFYENRSTRGDISLVEVVGHQQDGTIGRIGVRYKFTGSVSPAVRAIVDPEKLSWVTRTDIEREARRSSFTIAPDYYPDRLECHGTFRFDEGEGGTNSTVITIEGDLRVHVFLVSRTVEQMIVNGLRTYLTAEVATLPDFTERG